MNINMRVLPVTYAMILDATKNDQRIQTIITYLDSKWPECQNISDKYIKQFFLRRESFSVVQNCLFYGERIVVPETYQQRDLNQLHKHHPGME